MKGPFVIVASMLVLGGCGDPSGPEGGEPVARAEALATGYRHACVLEADGSAWCWGLNTSGQLGRATAGEWSAEPAPVSGGHRFVAISAGGSTTCGLTATGAAYCWGLNSTGQLGPVAAGQSASPLRVQTPEALVEIDVGYGFVCGRSSSGASYCWGRNDRGQSGSGEVTPDPVPPTKVAGGLAFESQTAGLVQACGLTAGGAAYCWGGGQFGALGTGDTDPRPAPTAVAGGLTFEQLAAGTTTTCGVTAAGATYCWGQNQFGTVGNGTVTTELVLEPARLAADPGLAWAGPGGENSVFTVSCGLTAMGAGYCWGPNAFGALGSEAAMETCGPLTAGGDTFGCTGDPVAVQGDLRFSVLRPSNAFVCGITTQGELYCWGTNAEGQLGVTGVAGSCNAVGEPTPCTFEPVRVAAGLILP